MKKGVVLAFILGWALAFLIAPRDVLGMFRPRATA
jgi:hypothetical protein